MKFAGLCLFYICAMTASVIPKDILSDEKHFKGGEHNAEYDHEAFVGQEEAQKFKELTPEQSKERLSKMLPVIDKDADDQLSREELKAHIRFMQKRYVQKDVDRTWKNHEGDAKGSIPWQDYRKMVYGPEEESNKLTKEYTDMMARDQRRWKAADLNHDDQLNKEEYGCFMHPEDCEHMKDIVVTETMGDIDKNGDGFVSLEEYIGDMYRPEDHPDQKGEEPDWVKSEREMFKQYRDKNGDGKLDKEEMKEWIMPSGFDHAEAEANHLIYMADDNKDGQLSKDEILAHYDVFVGSQATDYGEQLQKHDPTEL